MNVKLEDFADELAKTIADYTQDVKIEIDKASEDVGKQTKKLVKDKAPYRHGDYRKSISLKTEKQLLGNKKSIIYAKAPHYRLTHLLEHGHATRNGGRTRAFPHWQQAEHEAIEEYEKRVIKAIENGGKT